MKIIHKKNMECKMNSIEFDKKVHSVHLYIRVNDYHT